MEAKYRLSKKNMISLIIYVLLIILCSVLVVRYNQISEVLYSQQAANRWQGQNNTRFSQVSVFFSSDNRATQDDIDNFRQKVIKKLSEISLNNNKKSKLWIDAYSAQSKITISTKHNSINTMAFGIGGEYFFFHPLRLRSGGYISEDDLSRDRIVLDEEAAWNLYGSVDIAGMEAQINNKRYIIAGVIENETDKFSNMTQSNNGQIYMHYDIFSQISDIDINCYEIVLPDPIPGFSHTLVSNGFERSQKEIVNNSERFDVQSILSLMTNLNSMVIHSKGIAFPYWENAARLVECRLVSILFLTIILVLFLLISFVVFIKKHKKLIRSKIKMLMTAIKNF